MPKEPKFRVIDQQRGPQTARDLEAALNEGFRIDDDRVLGFVILIKEEDEGRGPEE